VIVEAHALFLHRSRPGRETALKFLDTVYGGAYEVVRVSRDDEAKAIELVIAQRDKMYSLCDALSFVVIERLQIREAISFDQDFRSYGRFTIL
jgi:uncharacterized protein